MHAAASGTQQHLHHNTPPPHQPNNKQQYEPSKESLVILVDAGPSMMELTPEEHDDDGAPLPRQTYLAVALDAVRRVMRWRIQHAPNDEIGVLAYGAVSRGGGGSWWWRLLVAAAVVVVARSAGGVGRGLSSRTHPRAHKTQHTANTNTYTINTTANITIKRPTSTLTPRLTRCTRCCP